MTYDHVVFDLDGTLIDSRADLAAAVNHMLQTLSLPTLSAATVAAHVGEGARLLVARALGASQQIHLEGGLRIFVEYYGAHLLEHTRPYAGVSEALAALTAHGIALSVLTNKPVAMSRAILDGLGMLSTFVAVLGDGSAVARKPDPAGLLHLQALTATAADKMLLVGDSAIDLRTARAAGVAFCGVAWGFSPDGLRAAGAQRIIERPTQLVPLVTGIQS